MKLTAQDALDKLLSQTLRRFKDMPNAVGLYGLGDHEGKLHYFGMTDSKSFRDRIWSRHITGSEDRSHKLACNYSVGRLWYVDKHPGTNKSDGPVARKARRAFIRRHCCFFCLPLDISKGELQQLEKTLSISLGLISPTGTRPGNEWLRSMNPRNWSMRSFSSWIYLLAKLRR